MRILLLAARFYPHRGGLESTVYHLAQEFRQKGHDVLVVANRYPRALPADEVVDGIRVLRLRFLHPEVRFLREKRLLLLLGSFWYALATTWALYQTIRRFRPDVVNLQYLGSPGLFIWLLEFRLCFPLVISLQGGDVDGEPFRDRFNAWRFRAVIERASLVTACSRDLADQANELSACLSRKLRVIPNGVNWERFVAAPAHPHPRPYVAAVGQLVPHKGFDLLINAFGDVAYAFPRVDLLIAGEGESRPDLLSLIRARDLVDRVQLLGKVDESMVASLMAGSIFVAMPSRREPFGIVALEGMAAGKRVLATPVGGIPEFLLPAVNRMVEPDRAAWATALIDWLTSDDAAEADGLTNQTWARRFAWSHVAERYLETYTDAVALTGRGKQ